MKIRFEPHNVEVDLDPAKTLLQIAQENKIPVKSLCKGTLTCGECRIKILEGENNILPPSKAEMTLLGTNYFIDHRRFACQVRCFGKVVIDASEQVQRQETQSKKLRGFRSARGDADSKAVQGTLVLDEKPPLDAPPKEPRQQQRPQQQRREPNNRQK